MASEQGQDRYPHLSAGQRIHIRSLKVEIRDLSTSEPDAWTKIEELLGMQITGWPERYREAMGLIRAFHASYYAQTHGIPPEEQARREAVIDGFDPEQFVLARPALRVVMQAYKQRDL